MAKKKSHYSRSRSDDALEQSYRSIASSKSRKGSKSNKASKIIIVCLTVMVIAIIVFISCVCFANMDPNKTILDNISIAGVDVGGMTQAQAIQSVQSAISTTYGKTPMVVKVLDEQIEIPAEYCTKLDVRAAVRAAYRYGQSGSESKRQQEQQTALTTGYVLDLSPYLTLNEKGIQDALAQLGTKYNSTLSESAYEIVGNEPDQKLIIQLGIPEYGLNLDSLYDQVIAAYSNNIFSVEGQCGMIEPEPIDLDAIHTEYYRAPEDAHLDPDTFEVVAGKDGYGFDLEEAKSVLKNAKYGSTVEIPFSSIQPEITAEKLSATLFRDELSTYTAASTSNANRDRNLFLACKAIDGLVLNPGEVFSYNATLGERTTDKGYKPGLSYSGSETVETIGGGICQVSSSLYYCAMVADLEILTRDNHGFATSYMPLGMDATVSWGVVDFRIRNNQDYPIRIEASASGGNTTVTLMGTDTKDYYVKMEYEVLATYNYETSYKTMEANNTQGYKDGDYITEPYTGYDVKTYRCKYSKDSDELISKELEATSNYSKRDAVICKIEDSKPNDNNSDSPLPGIGNGAVTEEGALPPELP